MQILNAVLDGTLGSVFLKSSGGFGISKEKVVFFSSSIAWLWFITKSDLTGERLWFMTKSD